MPAKHSDENSPQRRKRLLLISAGAGVLVVALILGATFLIDGSDSRPTAHANAAKSVPELSAAQLRKLPEADTFATIKGAPADKSPARATSGTVVHPMATAAVYDAPGGKPIAKVKPKQLGMTWLPAVGGQAGWVQVLLPSRPNASTGWLRAEDVRGARTPYVIHVHLKSMELQLLKDGKDAGTWPIGIGKPDTPTPTGRTFLLGSITDKKQAFSPVILPLGSHSDTLDSFGGGPGTVAIHTWPTTDVFGTESSHGCIQVPEDALDHLTEVPLGTLVLVDKH